MLNANQIKPNTPVVCSQNGQFGVVDHMEGADSIKLKKDAHGQHHYIPLSWVKNVDDKIHVDRPGAQAMKEWTTASATSGKKDGAPMSDRSASTTDRAPSMDRESSSERGSSNERGMSSERGSSNERGMSSERGSSTERSSSASQGKADSSSAKDAAGAKSGGAYAKTGAKSDSDGETTDKFDHATDIAMPATGKKKPV